MNAIRGKKKGVSGERYFLSHADTVIVEEGNTKTTLSQKLQNLNASTVNGFSIQVVNALPASPSPNTIYIVQ